MEQQVHTSLLRAPQKAWKTSGAICACGEHELRVILILLAESPEETDEVRTCCSACGMLRQEPIMFA